MDYDRRYRDLRHIKFSTHIHNTSDVTVSRFFQEKGFSKFEIYLVFDDNLEVSTRGTAVHLIP